MRDEGELIGVNGERKGREGRKGKEGTKAREGRKEKGPHNGDRWRMIDRPSKDEERQ